MANWKGIPESSYKKFFVSDYSSDPPDNDPSFSYIGYITLAYDKDTITATSVKLRFTFSIINAQANLYDTYFALLNPKSEDAPGTLVPLKVDYTNPDTSWAEEPDWPYIGGWGKTSSNEPFTFTLTKSASARSFSMPTLWFCNDGGNHTYDQGNGKKGTALDFYKNYNDDTWRGQELRATYSGATLDTEAIPDLITNGTVPTVLIVDNKNNTFSISGKLGTKGELNPLESATLYYTTNGDDPSDSESSRKSVSLTATSGASYAKNNLAISKAGTVKAYVVCKFKYNTTTATDSLDVIYYAAPTAPGKPVLSYTKSRLTVKEPWKFTWTKATAGNSKSPLKGYEVALMRKPKNATVFIAADIKELASAATEIIYQDPAALSFVPGDTVQLWLTAYSVNGLGTKLTTFVMSDEYVVRNAGIVNIKVGGSWKEGQVFIKVSGNWKEAETVNVKTNGAWKESQ
jgi:hypothetical protein